MAQPGVGAYESNGNLDKIAAAEGNPSDAAVTNVTLSASQVALLKGIISQLQSGGTSGTQYTDGSAAPTHPIGTEIVYNLNGTMTAVSNSSSFPVYGSGPSIGTDGSATPTSSTLIGGSDGTNLQGALVESSSHPNLRMGVYAGANEWGIDASGKGPVKAATNDIVDIATLLARLTDTFGSSTPISAATTFGSIPLISALATSSYATLTNASYQDTFIVQINVASAFNGTIAFYGLLPDGATLQAINAHQRGTATNGNSTPINTSSAIEQTWEGSIAGFKAIYVVCTAFTSGAASVQIGLTAASYAHAIINTVASNLTQLNGTAISNTNPLPSQDIEQQGYIAATSPPSTTNAGSDTAYTFSSQINRVIIQNNTSANLNFDFDQAASAGSFLCLPGTMIIYPKKCTALHLYTAAAQNINGSTSGNIIVRGAL
jgi:hypothetical protein